MDPRLDTSSPLAIANSLTGETQLAGVANILHG